MSGKYLLDTCFLIGLQQRNPEALRLLEEFPLELAECAYSVITRVELLSFPSLSGEDELTVRALLSAMRALPLSGPVEDEAIRIRRQRRVKLPDALILGTARAHGLKLLTLDRHLSGLSADL
jgi:predicted nucleic acid-binding protein